jgi:hypothetical protein
MDAPIPRFLQLFQSLAGDAAEAWCGDRRATTKLFKGSSYSQRHKEWFPAEEELLPRRAMRHHDYDVLRQLLRRARNKSGQSPIKDETIRELDAAFISYIEEMDRVDARRNRGTSARTLHVNAANERVERALAKHGFNFDDLKQVDFVKGEFRRITSRPILIGDLHEVVRIYRAFCVVLEKQPGRLGGFERARYICAASCAILGHWAAFNTGDEVSYRYFNSFLGRLYGVFPDVVVLMFWWLGKKPSMLRDNDAVFRVFSIRDQISTSSVVNDWSPSFFSLDGAISTSALGIRLDERTNLLDGNSAEQLLLRRLSEIEVNSRAYPDLEIAYSNAFTSVFYGKILAKDLRFEEAWKVLHGVRENLDRLNKTALYAELLLKHAEASALHAEWKVSKQPNLLVACVRKVDEGIALAEQMNFTNHAEMLRGMHLA